MRYRLRTLLIVLALGPPLLAWLWTTPEWEKYRTARANVEARRLELTIAKALPGGTRQSLAALRHTELRYVRADAQARDTSLLYRALAPDVRN